MERTEIPDRLRARLGAGLLGLEEPSGRRLYAEVAPADIREVSRFLFRDLGARFQIASGVDTPDAIEILYHWAFDALGCILTVRTRLDRSDPEIDSIADLCMGAEWIEREMWELLGIRFRNHPDLRHLLLADDWPAGKYPLRRDYRRGS
jgi:NADH:ubiquinone oxidoreductase subunit C